MTDVARSHHERSLTAVRGSYVLLLRDFGDEDMYDLSPPPLIAGWGEDRRKRFFRRLTALAGTDHPVVTLANPTDPGPLDRLGCGVNHLFVDPQLWRDAVKELIRDAHLIIVFIGRGSEGMQLELRCVAELGRTASLICIVDGDEITEPFCLDVAGAVTLGEFFAPDFRLWY